MLQSQSRSVKVCEDRGWLSFLLFVQVLQRGKRKKEGGVLRDIKNQDSIHSHHSSSSGGGGRGGGGGGGGGSSSSSSNSSSSSSSSSMSNKR